MASSSLCFSDFAVKNTTYETAFISIRLEIVVYDTIIVVMKGIISTLLLIILCTLAASAQTKHDYIWPIGYGMIGQSPSGHQFGGIIMDFNQSPISFTLQDYICDRPRAAISDKNGRLVAYSQGCKVFDANHQVMLNGDTLGPGNVFNAYCGQNGDYPDYQPCIFLTSPNSDSLYYLFHIRGDDYWWSPMNLMYTVIDASKENGLGAVVAKNQSILSDSFFLGGYVAATRHGNGRDWWIISPRRWSFNIHVASLTPEGVNYTGMQNFDTLGWVVDSSFCCSQTAFSQDGRKYFRNSRDNLVAYDFDRCSGKLSNPVKLDWDSLPFGGGGVATSPNSRFLYLTSGGTVQQYDLWAPDWKNSMQVVAVYDGTLAPFPANFFQMMPGPDGKIYIVTSYDNNVLHVIHAPNEPGLACMVEQHAITLPALSSFFSPNFANYNLGPVDPPCMISGTEESDMTLLTAGQLHIWPNPTTDAVYWYGSGVRSSIQLYDATGKWLFSTKINPEENMYSLDLSKLQPGLYMIRLECEGRTCLARVVKQ